MMRAKERQATLRKQWKTAMWGILTPSQKRRTRRRGWRGSLGKWRCLTQRGKRPQTWTSSTARYQSIFPSGFTVWLTPLLQDWELGEPTCLRTLGFSLELHQNHWKCVSPDNITGGLEKVCWWENSDEIHVWSTLQELELYDNQIKKLENLSGLVNLKMLDVSHNMLRRIEGLEGLARCEFLTWILVMNSWHMCHTQFLEVRCSWIMKTGYELIHSSLERLYLVSNKISKIENLDCCPKLNMLELGDNKIRKVGCFQYLPYFDYCFIFNLICF